MSKKEIEISAIQAARILGVGLDYLYGLIWTGKLDARKEGNRWRVSVASVDSRFRALRGSND